MKARMFAMAGALAALAKGVSAQDGQVLRPLSELMPAPPGDAVREGARRSLLQRGPGVFAMADGRELPFVYDTLLPDSVDLAMTCRAVLSADGPAPGVTDAATVIARANLPATLVATTSAIVAVGVEERVAPLPTAGDCRAAMAILAIR